MTDIVVQLNCLFVKNKSSTFVKKAELWKPKGFIWRLYLFFLLSEEREHVAALLTLKVKRFTALTLKQYGKNDKQFCVNVFSDHWKDTLRAERELYSSVLESVSARSIVHKSNSSNGFEWTKPERKFWLRKWSSR